MGTKEFVPFHLVMDTLAIPSSLSNGCQRSFQVVTKNKFEIILMLKESIPKCAVSSIEEINQWVMLHWWDIIKTWTATHLSYFQFYLTFLWTRDVS